MIITSPSFETEAPVPRKFTCDGYDINPELQIHYAPAEAKSLALIMDDPDAPGGTWTHWTIWNIPPDAEFIKEESVAPGSVEGTTSAGRTGFHGPCPPPGAPHRYFFRLYALDAMLDLKEGASREELEGKIKTHLLASAELMGTYVRA